LNLWDGTPPNSKPSELIEKWDTTDIVRISNVTIPGIDVYIPSKEIATRQAVVICPGGGYGILAYDKEGTDMAKWLNGKGIAAIVLKYRLPNPQSSVVLNLSPLTDAKRAMKITRFNAEKWNINPDKIGIMGFSAGGHLASTVGTHFDEGNVNSVDPIDKLSSKPDFMILVYPVISMDDAITHQGSKTNLLGENPSGELVKEYSNELQVKENTPSTFLVHCQDDKAVSVQNSFRFYNALMDQNIPSEMHIFPKGGHGFGFGYGKGQISSWIDLCFNWMQNLE
jgi:acetyl esterase/lipase